MTPMGAVPISFELDAATLDSAIAKFGAAAEEAIVRRLEALHETGLDFVLVSEELGERRFGQHPEWHVVIDPIDGSVNAKRGIPFFSLSVAVASGGRMGDVRGNGIAKPQCRGSLRQDAQRAEIATQAPLFHMPFVIVGGKGRDYVRCRDIYLDDDHKGMRHRTTRSGRIKRRTNIRRRKQLGPASGWRPPSMFGELGRTR